MELINGQNYEIDFKLAYQLSVNSKGWKLGVLVKNSGNYGFLTNNTGISLVNNSIFLNLQDADDTVNEVIVYAQREGVVAEDISCTLKTSLSGTHVVSCESGLIDPLLTVVEAVHFYRKNSKWKIKSFFQGYESGLTGMLLKKGMGPAERDGKDESAVGVNLEVSLNWSPSSSEHFDTSTAYLGSEFQPQSNLNICCLYVLKSGQRGMIHGGEESLAGSFHGIPYASIVSNRDAGLSTISFNSKYSHKMFKYIICAEITEGSRCWSDTLVNIELSINGSKTVQMVDSPLYTPIYVSHVIEIIDGNVTQKAINTYYANYKEVDLAVGFSIA